MATLIRKESAPLVLRDFSRLWLSAIGVLLLLVAAGAYAYSRQIIEGEIVTGLRDVGTGGGAPWGLYIVFGLWAVGIGFGAMILLGSIKLFRLRHMEPLTRPLAVAGLATLFIGGWSIMADVGQPLRAMFNIMRYARPMSPFFGTFTIGLVAAFASMLVYLYLEGRHDAAELAKRPGALQGWFRLTATGYRDTAAERMRRYRTGIALALILIVVGVVAASTSGLVFGIQQGRPGWFGALQAPGFVVLAGATGVAAAILVAGMLRASMGETELLSMRMFRWLNNLMLVMTIIYVYFLVVELVTSGYSGTAHQERITDAIIKGEYAWLFWSSNALFLITALIAAAQAITGRYRIRYIIVAAVLLNVAAFFKRYLIVVPGLTVGRLLPYPEGSYSPTWVEYLVVIGLVALGVIFFMVFMRLFPIFGLSHAGDESVGNKGGS
ncbi:MAG: polysulfide reductase NrfD [Chloroflexi bacterium]|nr:polysulfide reductase NrfD [Chloroflexota bacterium]